MTGSLTVVLHPSQQFIKKSDTSTHLETYLAVFYLYDKILLELSFQWLEIIRCCAMRTQLTLLNRCPP